MNHMVSPTPGRPRRKHARRRQQAEKAGHFERRADALITTLSVSLISFVTLGGLGMLLIGVGLHRFGFPNVLIWISVGAVAAVAAAGTCRLAAAVWKHEMAQTAQTDAG